MAKLQDGNSDIRAGINIVLNALEAPARQIAENAERRGSIVVGRVSDNKSAAFGFDAQTRSMATCCSRAPVISDGAFYVNRAAVGSAAVERRHLEVCGGLSII